MALPTSKVGKVLKSEFFDHAIEINRLATGLGTFNNPVTDALAARPEGLLYVVWDTPTDPTNWVNGDFNLQAGT